MLSPNLIRIETIWKVVSIRCSRSPTVLVLFVYRVMLQCELIWDWFGIMNQQSNDGFCGMEENWKRALGSIASPVFKFRACMWWSIFQTEAIEVPTDVVLFLFRGSEVDLRTVFYRYYELSRLVWGGGKGRKDARYRRVLPQLGQVRSGIGFSS